MSNTDKGLMYIASGKLVFNTGRVLIGIRWEPRKTYPGVHAEWLQALLLKEKRDA